MKPTKEDIKNLVPQHLKDHEVIICETEPDKEMALASFGRRIGEFFIGFYQSKNVRKVLYVVIMLAAAADGYWSFMEIKNPEHQQIVIQNFESPEIWNKNLDSFQSPENRNHVFFIGSFGSPSPIDATFPQARENMFYAISGSNILPSRNSPYNSGSTG